MPWKKDKQETLYSVIEQESCLVYHKSEEVSTKHLNDPLRNFASDSGRATHFIGEYIKTGGEGDVLPSDLYKVIERQFDRYLKPITIQHDKLLFKLDIINDVIKDFINFRDKKHIYDDESGWLYKRGILLYGPPGTGKTTAIFSILEDIRPEDSIVIYLNKVLLPLDMLEELRKDDRLKIIILEEITHIANRKLDELLTFLDGDNTMSNSYVIATTNYPEKLPGNLVERPGRFDRMFEVKYPSEEDRKLYLKHFFKREPSIQEVEVTKNQSLAFIKEMILITKLDNVSLEDAHKRVLQHQTIAKNQFKDSIKEEDLDDHIL